MSSILNDAAVLLFSYSNRMNDIELKLIAPILEVGVERSIVIFDQLFEFSPVSVYRL